MQARKNAQSSPDKIAAALDEVRIKLSVSMADRFPQYVNKTMLWSDPGVTHGETQRPPRAKPPEETDPSIIKFYKHVHLALESASHLAELAQEFTQRSLGGKVLRAADTFYRAYTILNSELAHHLKALKKIAEAANLPEAAKNSLNLILQTFTGLNLDQLRAGQVGMLSSDLTARLNKELPSLLDTFIHIQRPATPATPTPARKYQQPKKKVTEDKASKFMKLYKPVAELREPARAAGLVVTELHTILSDAIDKQKKNTAFDASQTTMIKTALYSLINAKIDKDGYLKLAKVKKEKKPKIPKEKDTKGSKDLKKDTPKPETKAEAKEVKIEQKETEVIVETPLSEVFKIGFNLIWTVKRMTENPDPSIWQLGKLGLKAKPYLDRLDEIKLDTQNMDKNTRAIVEISIQAALAHVRDMLLPGITSLTQHLRQFELDNHLKYGSLLKEVRPVFNQLEGLCLSWGVSFTNPLGNVDAHVKEIKAKFHKISEEYEGLHKKTLMVRFIDQHLKQYAADKNFNKSWLVKNMSKLRAEITAPDDLAAFELIQRNIALGVALPKAELERVLKLIHDTENSLNNKFAAKNMEYQSANESMLEQKKVQWEFLVYKLKNDGLNYYVRAVQAGASDPEINLGQKRLLAALVADYKKVDRMPFLKDAHRIAMDFSHSLQLRDMVIDLHKGKLGSENKSLGHNLAIELVIAGIVKITDFPKDIFITHDNKVQFKDAIDILTRIEAGQVNDLLKAAHAGNQEARKRMALFTLLISDKDLSAENINNILDAPLLAESTTEQWFKTFIDRYNTLNDLINRRAIDNAIPKDKLDIWRMQQPEYELLRNIGLFLGRMAHSQEDIARIIFSQGQHAVKEAALSVKQPALYYESLVNTFQFDNRYERMTFQDFLRNNAQILLTLHSALHEDDLKDTKSILEYYQVNPIEAMELINNFIKKNISHSSSAERKMQQFFTAMILCSNSKEMREKIVTNVIKMQRSMHAPLAVQIISEANKQFWMMVRDDMVSEYKTGASLEEKTSAVAMDIKLSLQPLLGKLSPVAKAQQSKIPAAMVAQTDIIKTTLMELKEKEKGDFSTHCCFARQAIDDAKQAIKAATVVWINDITKSHLEEIKKELKEAQDKAVTALKHKMSVRRIPEVISSRLIEEMKRFNSSAELDSIYRATEDTASASALMQQLSDAGAKVQKAMAEKFVQWSAEFEEAYVKYQETESLKSVYKKLIDLFDRTIYNKEEEKQLKPYKEILEFKNYKAMFNNPAYYWEDAAKIYKALEVIHTRFSKYPIERKSAEAMPKLQAMIEPELRKIEARFIQALTQAIHKQDVSELENLLKALPELQLSDQKIPYLNRYVVLRAQAVHVRHNLIALKEARLLINEVKNASPEFKLEMEAMFNEFLTRQQEVMRNLAKCLSGEEKLSPQEYLTTAQVELNEALAAISNRMINYHRDALHQQLSESFVNVRNRLDNEISNLTISDDFSRDLKNKMDQFFLSQQQELKAVNTESPHNAIKKLSEKANLIQEAIKAAEVRWTQAINANSKIMSSELGDLKISLQQMRKIIQEYVDNRGKWAFLYSVVRSPLRGQKIDLARNFLSMIDDIEEKLAKNPADCFVQAQTLIKGFEQFKDAHNNLIAVFPSDKKEEKSGDLGREINKIEALDPYVRLKQQSIPMQEVKADIKRSS